MKTSSFWIFGYFRGDETLINQVKVYMASERNLSLINVEHKAKHTSLDWITSPLRGWARGHCYPYLTSSMVRRRKRRSLELTEILVPNYTTDSKLINMLWLSPLTQQFNRMIRIIQPIGSDLHITPWILCNKDIQVRYISNKYVQSNVILTHYSRHHFRREIVQLIEKF